MDAATSVGCITVIVGLVSMPILYMLNGWVLSILWRWFLVPLGAPTLTIPYAIGIALIVGSLTRQVLTPSHKDDRKPEEKLTDAGAGLIACYVGPLLTLLVGWIVHSL